MDIKRSIRSLVFCKVSEKVGKGSLTIFKPTTLSLYTTSLTNPVFSSKIIRGLTLVSVKGTLTGTPRESSKAIVSGLLLKTPMPSEST